MERLTECVGYQNNKPIYKTKIDMRKIGSVDKLKNALGAYEDAEEQGLLLRLPCKVETSYWTFDSQYWIEEEKCKGCEHYFDCDTETFCDADKDYPKCTQIVEKVFLNNLEIVSLMNHFGKTVFLTKEAAEQALKRMGERA